MLPIVIAFAYGLFVMAFWRYVLDGRTPKLRDWTIVIFFGWIMAPLSICMRSMVLIFVGIVDGFKWLKRKW